MDSCLLCKTPLSQQNLALKRKFPGYDANFDLYRCPSCRFIQTEPMPSIESIKSEYGDEYMAYNQDNEKVSRISADKRLRMILKHCEKRANLKLLDVGCSTGWFMQHAKSKGLDVYGVELSKYAVDKAISALGKEHVQNSLLEESTFKENDFDIIYSNQVIEHTPDPVLFLSVITKYLKSSGILVLGTPNGDSLAMHRLGGNWASVQKPDHIVFFNPTNLRSTLEKQGYTFKNTYHTGTPYFPSSKAYKSIVDTNLNLKNRVSNRNKQTNKSLKKSIMNNSLASRLVSYATNILHLGDTFLIIAQKR